MLLCGYTEVIDVRHYDFWDKMFSKTVEYAEIYKMGESTTDSLVILINVEREDEVQKDKVVKKAVNNISWLAKSSHNYDNPENESEKYAI